MHYEMPPAGDHSPRVERKRQARKRDILRRALTLATTEGDDVLTVGRLAEELDYTPGALYRYFPSKDALVAEVQRCIIVYLGHALAEVVHRSQAATGPGFASAVGMCLFATRPQDECWDFDLPVERQGVKSFRRAVRWFKANW